MKAPLPRFAARAIFALMAGLLSGCNTPIRRPAKPTVIPAEFADVPALDVPSLDPALLQRPAVEYRIGPGDVFDFEVIGEVNTQATSVVGPDGKIYFYLLPGIDVWGLTIAQARQRVLQEMQKVVRDQQPVSLTLRKAESQRIWLLGRLNQPGIYPMAGPMTLLEALSAAGGPAAGGERTASRPADHAADLSRAFLLRRGRMLRVDFSRLVREGDIAQNVYLQPDDFILIPSTVPQVHVLGAVESPRALDFVNQLTLRQAVSLAGALARDAHLAQVAIVRGPLTQPTVAVVDLATILAGEAPDIALEPQDIVFVPREPHPVLAHYVDLILETLVRTLAVNAVAPAF